MPQLEINKDTLPTIKAIIQEYSEHDAEAFETRTELFRVAIAMAEKLEELLNEK